MCIYAERWLSLFHQIESVDQSSAPSYVRSAAIVSPTKTTTLISACLATSAITSRPISSRISPICNNPCLRRGGGKEDKKGKGKSKKDDDDEEGGEEFDVSQVKPLFDAPLAALKRELDAIRIARASPSLLDQIYVDGTPLSGLAQIIIKDSQTIQISPFDSSSLKDIEKAIREGNLTPVMKGEVITVTPPKITAEHRENLKKSAAQAGERIKGSVRNSRKSAMDIIKKAKLPKDDERRAETEVQHIVDEATKTITNAVEAKTKELSS
ncbi:hypothetical protein PROFUN_15300 [Planoprotostelium fungivorum]|uniref:Ribosome recycling factor domain-containing protein n=1 Tax=Planoprotostelium fungivorum TaxID=1890364 RepID=A0A2P6MXD4_9EUKA|nr:hypothetical protein PROFUN_15300 [Planoprotostelium fungivorum]